MPVDRPLTLASRTQMERGPLSHLVAGMKVDELDDLLMRATRACEAACGRRLTPFTGLVEVHRADGVPSDGWSFLPAGSPFGAVGAAGYAAALGGGQQVRSVWVDVTP